MRPKPSKGDGTQVGVADLERLRDQVEIGQADFDRPCASFEARGVYHRAGHFGPDPLARASG